MHGWQHRTCIPRVKITQLLCVLLMICSSSIGPPPPSGRVVLDLGALLRRGLVWLPYLVVMREAGPLSFE